MNSDNTLRLFFINILKVISNVHLVNGNMVLTLIRYQAEKLSGML